MSPEWCEFCETATGLHLSDCPSRAVDETPTDIIRAGIQQVFGVDPYDHTAPQPALAGSMWGTDMDGQKRPQGKPEDIPVERIITKRTR